MMVAGSKACRHLRIHRSWPTSQIHQSLVPAVREMEGLKISPLLIIRWSGLTTPMLPKNLAQVRPQPFKSQAVQSLTECIVPANYPSENTTDFVSPPLDPFYSFSSLDAIVDHNQKRLDPLHTGQVFSGDPWSTERRREEAVVEPDALLFSLEYECPTISPHMDYGYPMPDQRYCASINSPCFSPAMDTLSMVGSRLSSPGTSFSAPVSPFNNTGHINWAPPCPDITFGGYGFPSQSMQQNVPCVSPTVNSLDESTSAWNSVASPRSPFSDMGLSNQASDQGFEFVPSLAAAQSRPTPLPGNISSPPLLQSPSLAVLFIQEPSLKSIAKSDTEVGANARRLGPVRPPSEAATASPLRKGRPGGRSLGSKLLPTAAVHAGKMRGIGACWPCVFSRDRVGIPLHLQCLVHVLILKFSAAMVRSATAVATGPFAIIPATVCAVSETIFHHI